MPTRFLHDDAILTYLRARNEGRGSKSLAVAYWGSDAITRLGLGADLRQVKIICDPWTGFCDPESLGALLGAGAKIRTIPGFHAKTYLYADAVVVGSANASAMGLGDLETPPTRMESAMATDDPALVSSAKEWFKLAWSKGKLFGPEMLPAVVELKRRRQRIEREALPSLLHAIALEGSLFRGMDVRVHIYEGEATNAADEAWHSVAVARYSAADRAMYEARGETPYYEDESASVGEYLPGVIYLDFHRGPRGGMTYGGIWQVKEDPIVEIPGTDNVIALLDLLPSLAGRKDKASEMAALGRELRGLSIEEKDTWSINEKGIVAAAKRALG